MKTFISLFVFVVCGTIFFFFFIKVGLVSTYQTVRALCVAARWNKSQHAEPSRHHAYQYHEQNLALLVKQIDEIAESWLSHEYG